MAEEKGLHLESMIKPLVWGLLGCTVCITLLFIIAGLVISSSNVPVPSISMIVLVCAGISACFGGFIAARIHKRQGLIVGFLFGLLFAGVLVMCALIGTGTLVSVGSLIKLIVILVSSMLGGTLGVNYQKKRR